MIGQAVSMNCAGERATFTPEEMARQEASEREYLRRSCLEYALQSHSIIHLPHRGTVLDTAKLFEQYIAGGA